MKYCISNRQPKLILSQADEIKVRYEDRNTIIDLIEDYPNTTIILTIPRGEEIDWGRAQLYAEKTNFILAIEDLSLVPQCKSNGISFYWSYPIANFYELSQIALLEPAYLFVVAPAAFSMNLIKQITDIPVRVSPCPIYYDYLPTENRLKDFWIRPEDTKYYEEYVTTYEFFQFDLGIERTLIHIYKDNQEWNGNLNLLLTNLNVNVDNRGIPDEFGPTRIKCGQRCMSGGHCRFCDRAVSFSNVIKKEAQSRT